MKKVQIGLLIGSVAVLSVMGLVFCWVTPANAHLHGEGSHYFFTHMLCWTLMGVLLSMLAYMLGWRRWLKAAMFIAAGWVGLVAYAATCPLVNGHWGWISLGWLRINVLEFAPVVAALVAAYLVRLLKCKAIWAIGMALIAGATFWGLKIMDNQNRLEYLLPTQQRMAMDAHQTACAFLQNQCAGAVRESRWFGRTNIETKVIPESTTTSMPAVCAVLFGKWYLLLLTFALAFMGVAIGFFCKSREDEAMRGYALIWGGLVLIPAFLNIMGCVGFAPMFNLGIPFASFGGTLVVSTLLGLAILLSQCNEGTDARPLTSMDWAHIVVPVFALTIMTLWGVLGVSGRDQFNYMGPPRCVANPGLK